jgi:hypothetical protein
MWPFCLNQRSTFRVSRPAHVEGARTDVDVLLLEEAFELVPHARHRFPIPVLGTRREHAERHIWQLSRARIAASGDEGRRADERDGAYRARDER